MGSSKDKKFLEMDGAKIFEFALNEVPSQINKLISKSKNSIDSIDYFVFHQANKMMLNKIFEEIGISHDDINNFIDVTSNIYKKHNRCNLNILNLKILVFYLNY